MYLFMDSGYVPTLILLQFQKHIFFKNVYLTGYILKHMLKNVDCFYFTSFFTNFEAYIFDRGHLILGTLPSEGTKRALLCYDRVA